MDAQVKKSVPVQTTKARKVVLQPQAHREDESQPSTTAPLD